MWHAWEIREIPEGVWWRNLGDWDHLEDVAVGRKIILKRILKGWKEVDWFIKLRAGTSGRLY